jgi:WD repeat-containing protein 23
MLAASGLQHMLHAHGWPTTEEEEQERLEAEQEAEDDDEEDSDDDFMPMFRNRLRARQPGEVAQLPPVPNPQGKKLMSEGQFGTDKNYLDRLRQRKKSLATNLMWRELGIDTQTAQKRADQFMLQVSQIYVWA